MSCSDYALVFKALADETRLKIIKMLTEGELCACKILEGLLISQPTLSYHMKILILSGLVKGRKEGSWMRYSLDKSTIALLTKYCSCLNNKAMKKNSIKGGE